MNIIAFSIGTWTIIILFCSIIPIISVVLRNAETKLAKKLSPATSMKPDESIVTKLRALAKQAKNDVVLFPQATFQQAVNDEIPADLPFVPVNVGEIITFIADMAE